METARMLSAAPKRVLYGTTAAQQRKDRAKQCGHTCERPNTVVGPTPSDGVPVSVNYCYRDTCEHAAYREIRIMTGAEPVRINP